MFEQVTIAVRDEEKFAKLNSMIDAAFDGRDVEVFLNRVKNAKMRIRDFEGILKRGLLGKEAQDLFNSLPVSDQGLTRERYLKAVEAVPFELRERYFKIYAYY
jgi:hypothetical protein